MVALGYMVSSGPEKFRFPESVDLRAYSRKIQRSSQDRSSWDRSSRNRSSWDKSSQNRSSQGRLSQDKSSKDMSS